MVHAAQVQSLVQQCDMGQSPWISEREPRTRNRRRNRTEAVKSSVLTDRAVQSCQ